MFTDHEEVGVMSLNLRMVESILTFMLFSKQVAHTKCISKVHSENIHTKCLIFFPTNRSLPINRNSC